MIIVDGRESDKQISSFANLEELLTALMSGKDMADRIVTDVIVNEEPFSEIYPHQAEDMDCSGISKIEVRTRPAVKMAVDMAGELEKVARMMASGARKVGALFRESQDTDALELLQDLLDVTRDFMGMLQYLRSHYLGGADEEFVQKTEAFSSLISEMSDVLENEDWVLLSDLLEYEYAPACDDWRKIGQKMHAQLKAAIKE